MAARRYNWKPDLPDHRDHRFTVSKPVPLPVEFDQRPHWPLPYDQGQEGSCTGNGWAGVIEYCQMRQKRPSWVPARNFIYYCERELGGTIDQDSGAQIRDGAAALKKWGVCPESLMPYNTATFTQKPSPACYAEAVKEKIVQYLRVDNTRLHDLMAALAAGYPIVFGCTLYDSFESAEVAATGIVPMPNLAENTVGGHCMVIVGYKMINAKRYFIVRNSWGTSWGDHGYCYMDCDYLTNADLASDFWVLKSVA